MTTQYTTILKLALPVEGELSGTWGDVVNDNITQMVEQAVAGKAVVNTWSGNSHTLTTADGTTSESRCAILELTDTNTQLSGVGTVVCPTNTKLYIVDNNTARVITVKTSGGTGVAVPVGKTMLVYCDGTNVVEGVTHANSLSLGTSTVTADKILDEDNMSSNSATAIATQQSIKAYVDSQVGTVDTLAEILANGNTTGSTDIEVTTAQKVQFRDAAIYLNSSADGQLDIVADTEIQIATTTVDLNGNLDVSGTALVTGVLTTTAATVFNGGFASNADSTLGTDKKVQFRDSAIYINSSADGQLDIVADGEVQIATALVDINGNLDVSGTTNISGSTSFTKNAIASVAISGVARSSNTVTVTTSAVHGLSVNDLVNLNGVTDTSFNGYFTVTAVSSTTVFTFSQTAANASSSGGSTTEIVYNLNASGTALNQMNGPLNITANSPIDGLEITQSGAGNGLHVTGTTDLVGNLGISGTATGASSFATAAGGTFTTAAGNDLNLVYPDGRSLFFKEAGTTTLTLDNAQGATFAGKITADAGIDIDNINIDGTTIALSSGDLTLDVAGDIILDADGGDVFLRDAGSEFGRFQGSSQDLLIRNDTQDKDISFVGNDGGVTTTALALDMSAAGAATFNGEVLIPEKLSHVGDTDTHFKFAGANDIRIVAGGVEHAAFDGTIVFNQDSADMDFRVESNGNANMLFVDSNNNRVGIGTGAPSYEFVVSKDGSSGIEFGPQGINTTTSLVQFYNRSTAAYDTARFYAGGYDYYVGSVTNALTLGGSGVIANEGGSASLDFRVESDNNANAFLVDASADQVRTDAVFVHDADGSNQPFYITRSGGLDQALKVTLDDNNVMFTSVQDETSGANFIFYSTNATASNVNLAQFDYSSGTVFNEGGLSSLNFRVESDTISHALFVDSATGGVQFGESSSNPYSGLTTAHNIKGSSETAGAAPTGIYNVSGTANCPALNVLNRDSSTDTSNRFIQFYANVTSSTSTAMGGIVGNGASNVQFAAISDVREKQNIEALTNSLDKITSLNPVEFDWIASGEHCKAGFIAQEVEKVFPEFVVENMANEGQEERKGLTGGMTGGIVAHLVKAMQEQQELIKTLEARIAALES